MFKFSSISYTWRYPKALWIFIALEFAGTVPALALFAIAQPNLFRTKLWQIGFDNHFNSNPSMVLYAYANWEPIPKIPLVWSKFLTDFNVAISVLSMFILLVKVSMFIMHIWYPILSVIINGAITALWIVSFAGQMGPDHADARYPSNIAWYISKSCKYAEPYGGKTVHYCILAKATFAVTVFMAALFLANTILSIYSMIPSSSQRAANKMDLDDMQDHSPSSDSNSLKGKEWEMKTVPKMSGGGNSVPYTPRTLAFNTLDRQLPLRSETQGSAGGGGEKKKGMRWA